NDPVNYSVGAQSNATAEVADNDLPAITVGTCGPNPPPPRYAEAGGILDFHFCSDSVLHEPVTVHYRIDEIG
ncbi:hypothetical protein AB9K17_24260, partial [Salmonella enterica subsp. enterica serovar Kentucky]|uniref:hypothetical protein n=1 Tax=Salmonella enterica TaxID=28901 RepID=UPI003F4BB202